MPLFDWPVSVESNLRVEFLQDEIAFGNGYKQVVGRGANNRDMIWNVTIGPLHKLEAVEVRNFFEMHMDGTPFEWDEPDTGQRLHVRVKGYEVQPLSSVYRNVRAEFHACRTYP